MENATQALLIAAGVLIGVILLSMGVYLFNTMGSYAANTQKEIDDNAIAQFNDKFLKYNGLSNLTIQDAITIKNYALESNYTVDSNYDLTRDSAGANNEYIDVYIARGNNFRRKIWTLGVDDETLLKNNIDRTYSCSVQTNANTGRVYRIVLNGNWSI